MVAAARHACAAEALGPLDQHPVSPLLDAHAHLLELTRQRGDAVRFLDAELSGVADRGGPACGDGGDGERGDLVDEAWYELAADVRRPEVCRAEGETHRGFRGLLRSGPHRLDARAHRLEADQD